MSALLTSLIIDAATKIGAPIIRDVLAQKFGKAGSVVADAVIDVIADKAGVSPAALPNLPTGQLNEAILQAEEDVPAILQAATAQQAEANRLMMAEMDKGTIWTWAWRPAWMWFLMLVWGCHFIVFAVIKAATGVDLSIPNVDIASNLTLAYLGLYLGGHTVKEWKKARINE
ncbi:hypothetical protein ACRRRS_21855 (plasmid) [Brucella anthropi]|uniref:hypothetical protein n=1 Tax=Brucella anthropi TaxID=529 RepID=UPI003D7CE267